MLPAEAPVNTVAVVRGIAGDSMTELPSLAAEATKKSGLIWITIDGGERADPTWHHWYDGAVYVLAGGTEQPLRGLDTAERVAVTVRSKATGSRLVTWLATVRRVQPGSEEWDAVIPDLHVKRLNAPDGRQAPQRWARESVLVRLESTGELAESPGDLPDHSGAAPPVPTPATTSGPLPFVLGRPRR